MANGIHYYNSIPEKGGVLMELSIAMDEKDGIRTRKRAEFTWRQRTMMGEGGLLKCGLLIRLECVVVLTWPFPNSVRNQPR